MRVPSGFFVLFPLCFASYQVSVLVQDAVLPAMNCSDTFGTVDPLVGVKLGTQTARTGQRASTLNPSWNQTFTFANVANTDLLSFNVYDYDVATFETCLMSPQTAWTALTPNTWYQHTWGSNSLRFAIASSSSAPTLAPTFAPTFMPTSLPTAAPTSSPRICVFSQAFDSSQTNCQYPSYWRNSSQLNISFTCYGFTGATLDLYVYNDIRYGIDTQIHVKTFSPNSDIHTEAFVFAVPSSFQSCDPTQAYYLYVNGPLLDNYRSCNFLPDPAASNCNTITYPTANMQLSIVAPSFVAWSLTQGEWSDWNLEFYLYRDTLLLDPWWYLNSAPATSVSMNYDPSTLNLSVDNSSKFYVQAYYRRFYVFTVPVARSGLFTLNDHNPNDDMCAFAFESDAIRLRCCSSSFTRNDLCRLSTRSDIQIVVNDIVLSFEYTQDMCTAPIELAASPGFVWVVQQNSTTQTGSWSQAMTLISTNVTDLISDLKKRVLILSSSWVAGGTIPSRIVGAEASLELSVRCVASVLTLQLNLVGAFNVLGCGDEADLFQIWSSPPVVLPNHAPTTPTTASVAPTTVSVAPTPGGMSVAPTTASVAPTTVSVAPTTTSVSPTTTSVSPTTTSVSPTTTSVAPTPVSVAPTTTSVAPTTTSVAPTTVSVAPTVAPTTMGVAPTSAAAPTNGESSVPPTAASPTPDVSTISGCTHTGVSLLAMLLPPVAWLV